MEDYVYHVISKHKAAKVSTLVSDKRHFKKKSMTRDKEECFIMIKEKLITIINLYAHNNKTLKYMKQKLAELK